MNFSGKKILFIGIGFYDYERLIVQKLQQAGATVSYMSSVSNMRAVNFLYRLGLCKLAMWFKDRRRKRLIEKMDSNVDLIFAIKGQEINQKDFERLHQRNPNAQWVLYLWDSLVRHDNTELLFKYFPTIYSFDRQDCERDSRLKFRPLFFREYVESKEREYDLSFIGWAHSDRLQMIRVLKEELKNADKNYFLKLYYGPFDYLVQKHIKRTITKYDDDIVITRPIPYAKFKEVLSKSKVVLDISHPLQSGLTMRTIETLAAGCKLLTTNGDIVTYSQISPESYYILDRENPHIPIEMTTIDTNKQTQEIHLSKYFHIDDFLDEILSQYGA